MILRMRRWGAAILFGLAAAIFLTHLALGATKHLSVSLQPDMITLEPAGVCTVSIWVDYTDEPFDSYRSVMKWDSTILQYVTALEGTVMTDPCGTNTWFIVDPGVDSLEVEHVLFPCDTMVTGPGSVSDVVFEALSDGATDIVFDYIMFARDGTTLVARDTEIIAHGAHAIVGSAGIGRGPGDGSASLVILPNPARTFLIGCGESDLDLFGLGRNSMYICDARGRVVRRALSRVEGRGYQYVYVWDGLDDYGKPAGPGVYFLRFVAPAVPQTYKLILIR
jgi:hypothetical protein